MFFLITHTTCLEFKLTVLYVETSPHISPPQTELYRKDLSQFEVNARASTLKNASGIPEELSDGLLGSEHKPSASSSSTITPLVDVTENSKIESKTEVGNEDEDEEEDVVEEYADEYEDEYEDEYNDEEEEGEGEEGGDSSPKRHKTS